MWLKSHEAITADGIERIYNRSSNMHYRITGTALGAAGAFLWFMPFASLGERMYQAGNNIGGISYLLLASFVIASGLSWLRQYVPMLISGGISCAVCILFLFQAASGSLWGLIASAIVAVFLIATGISGIRATATPARARN
jgi:hypothetical protein